VIAFYTEQGIFVLRLQFDMVIINIQGKLIFNVFIRNDKVFIIFGGKYWFFDIF